jgi:hypothetical protein
MTMPGVHDFTNYPRRLRPRHLSASIDVRNGLLTREEGFELARNTTPSDLRR